MCAGETCRAACQMHTRMRTPAHTPPRHALPPHHAPADARRRPPHATPPRRPPQTRALPAAGRHTHPPLRGALDRGRTLAAGARTRARDACCAHALRAHAHARSRCNRAPPPPHCRPLVQPRDIPRPPSPPTRPPFHSPPPLTQLMPLPLPPGTHVHMHTHTHTHACLPQPPPTHKHTHACMRAGCAPGGAARRGQSPCLPPHSHTHTQTHSHTRVHMHA